MVLCLTEIPTNEKRKYIQSQGLEKFCDTFSSKDAADDVSLVRE